MRNTVRVVLAVFLAVLILSNYNAIRVLGRSIEFLDSDLQERAMSVLADVRGRLEDPSLPAGGGALQDFAAGAVQRYGIQGIVVYRVSGSSVSAFAAGFPEDLRNPDQILGNRQSLRRDRYLLVKGSYTDTGAPMPVVVYLDARRVFQIERTTRIVSYTNILLMAFAGVLVIYFFESAFRPFNKLVQAARSAPLTGASVESRNEADFLINTFNGVISSLKSKEQELERMHRSEKARADYAHQLNQDIIRSISSGLILVDEEGLIRVFNQPAESILRLKQSDLLGRRYQEGLAGAAVLLREDIARCFAQKAPVNRAELELPAEETGRAQVLTAGVMPLQDASGSFAGVLCLFSDITDFKRLQEHMAQKEKYASLGEMAGGVAHEFRNSLATVTGYIQMLESRITPEQTQYIAPIQQELHALQKVINDFLSFARPVQPELQDVALRNLLEDCAEEIRVSAPADLEITLRGEFPGIRGDEAMLRQVFLNLIRNAVQAVEGTGRQGQVVVSGTVEDGAGMLRMEVQDNGTGIPETDLTKIFTPFYSTKRDGVGLGLAIAKKLILQHNGSITVTSSNDGSTFRIHLPLASS